MTVRELYEILNEKIPSSLSCSWDNDGLMCCPDGARQVKKVLVTLDVTEEAVRRAAEGGYDLIVSHHPLIFKGIRAVNESNIVAAKAIDLIKSGISVMSFHTRLDALEGGVNDVLAKLLGLENAEPFGEEAIGRVGTLAEPMTAADFAARVKKALGAPAVVLADAKRSVFRVAVLGGSGSDDVEAACAAGADTYVTGELKYHQLVDAPEEGMNLIEAGHFYTEQPICGVLREWLLAIAPELSVDCFECCKIQVL